MGSFNIKVQCFPAILVRRLKICRLTLLCISNGFLSGHKQNIHPFSPRGVSQHLLLVKIQSRQITSKMTSIERTQKNKHFSCKNLGLEIIRSKVILILMLCYKYTNEVVCLLFYVLQHHVFDEGTLFILHNIQINYETDTKHIFKGE